MASITLYHGGESDELAQLRVFGLDEKRPFFMTPSRGLADAASRSCTRPGILEVAVPREAYDQAIRDGCLAERPYAGSIPWEGATEVKATHDGIRLLNRSIRSFY